MKIFRKQGLLLGAALLLALTTGCATTAARNVAPAEAAAQQETKQRGYGVVSLLLDCFKLIPTGIF